MVANPYTDKLDHNRDYRCSYSQNDALFMTVRTSEFGNSGNRNHSLRSEDSCLELIGECADDYYLH